MDRDNVEYAIHLHCKEKKKQVSWKYSMRIPESSSLLLRLVWKNRITKKKKKKKRRTDVDGDICKRRALGRGFSSDDCVFCFSRSRECVIELSFPEEREGERESSACQCQLWCQHGSILLPPVMYIYTFFFSSSSSGPPLSSQAKSSSPLGEGKRRTELNRRQQRGL